MVPAAIDKDALYSRLQNQFGDGVVVVVGSGLSCAEGLPGMGELAAHLETAVAARIDPAQRAEWSNLVAEIASLGLEAALLKTPPGSEIEAAIVACTGKLVAERERSVVEEVFRGGRTLRFSRLAGHLFKPADGIPVITTNYDRLLEIALEEAGLGVDTMFVGQFAGRLDENESKASFLRDVSLQGGKLRHRFQPRAIVFKPHGSLDWYDRGSEPVRFAGDLDAQRLIITPGLNKFRNGYERPFDVQRDRANGHIDKASRLIVLGYGFNDDHLETHLGPRIRAGVSTLIITMGLSPKAEQLARTAPNVVALDRPATGGGTRVFIDKAEHLLPAIELWDVGSFVTEVLEP